MKNSENGYISYEEDKDRNRNFLETNIDDFVLCFILKRHLCPEKRSNTV